MEEQTAKCIYCGESNSMKSLFVLDPDDVSVCPVFVYCSKCHYTCRAKLENIPEPCRKCGKYSEWEFTETELIDPVNKKCTYTKFELFCGGCKTLLSKTVGATKPTTSEIALYIEKFLNWKYDWKNILLRDLDKLESLVKKGQDISDALCILICYLPDRGDYTARDKAVRDYRRERVSRLAICAVENDTVIFPANTVLLRLVRSGWEPVKNIKMNAAKALILYDVKRKNLENIHELLKEYKGRDGKDLNPYLINGILEFLAKFLEKEKIKEIHDELEEIIYDKSKKLIKAEDIDKSVVETAIKSFIKISRKSDESVVNRFVGIARSGDRKETLTQTAVEALQEIYRKIKKLPSKIGKIDCVTCFSGRLYDSPKGLKLIKSEVEDEDNKEEWFSCEECGQCFLLTKFMSGGEIIHFSSHFIVFRKDVKAEDLIKKIEKEKYKFPPVEKEYTLYKGTDSC